MGLRENFEKFYEYSLRDLETETFKEVMWKFYVQGSHDSAGDGEDLSQEEVEKMIEDQCFFDFVKSCIENPNGKTKISNGDFVEVSYPCTDKTRCVGWPDRCKDIGCSGNIDTKIINLSKLCNIDPGKLNDAILTEDEINELVNTLTQ